MKKLLFCLLFLGLAFNCYAVTDFVIEVRDSAGDYATFAEVNTGLDEDITAATVKVFSFDANSGTIADGAAVSTDGGSSTAVCVHQSINGQILLKTIDGSFDNDDVVTDGSNTVTLSNDGDSAKITVTFYDDISASSWTGGVFSATNSLTLQGDTTSWDGTPDGAITITAGGAGTFSISTPYITVKNFAVTGNAENTIRLAQYVTVINTFCVGCGFSSRFDSTNLPRTLINAVSINSPGSGFSDYVSSGTGAPVNCYGCVSVGAGTYGFTEGGNWRSDFKCYNCISVDSTTADFNSVISGNYNACSDTSCDIYNINMQSIDPDTEFVSPVNNDFHLIPGRVLSILGYDYSSISGVDYDLDNNTREYPIGIGAFQGSVFDAEDTDAPVISNPLPATPIAANTTSQEISVDTDEIAYCMYSTTIATDMWEMEGHFTSTYATTHTVTMTGLETNATATDHVYYIRCLDDSDNYNESDYTFTLTVAADTTAPSQIDDLAVVECDQSSCDLSWTSVGNDADTGTADYYDLRYSTATINDGNWAGATQVTGEPTPKVAGQAETFTVTNLDPGETYYFAIKAVDPAGNAGALSNVPNETTVDVAEDYIKIWVANAHNKITQDELRLVEAEDVTSKIWDGTNVNIFGAKNEVVSFQTIIEAPLKTSGVITFEFDTLTHTDTSVIETSVAAEGNEVFDYVGRNIENFYVRYLQILGMSELQSSPCKFGYDERACYENMKRPDNNGSFDYLDTCSPTSECKAGNLTAWPDRPNADKWYPDIMIPMEIQKSFTITKNNNQSVWTDIYIPKTASTGDYTGNIVIKIDGVTYKTIPITLNVLNFSLPDEFNAKSWTWINTEDIWGRFIGDKWPEWIGSAQSEWEYREYALEVYERLFKLFKRHRMDITIGNGTGSQTNIISQITNDYPVEGALYKKIYDGTLFTSVNGYDGPGNEEPCNIYSIATYGFSISNVNRLNRYVVVFVDGEGTIPDDTACSVGGTAATCLHQGTGTYTDVDGYKWDGVADSILISGLASSSYTVGKNIIAGDVTLTVADKGTRYFTIGSGTLLLNGVIPMNSSCTTDEEATTLTCLYQTETGIMVKGIDGGTVDNGDIITDGDTFVTISDADGASIIYAFTIPLTEKIVQNFSDIWETFFKANYPDVERFIYLKDETGGISTMYQLNERAKWVTTGEGTGNTLKSLGTYKLHVRQLYMPFVNIVFDIKYTKSLTQTAWQWSLDNEKDMWIYNGERPNRGTFVIEDSGVALLVNEWGAFKHKTPRSFFWCGNCWKNSSYINYETDVFNLAQTFGRHAQGNGTACSTTNRVGCCIYNSNCGNGDGVLIYPGKDIKYHPNSSYELDGFFSSMRLKLWRNGLQQREYLYLADKIDSETVATLVASMIPEFNWEHDVANPNDPSYWYGDISWSEDPEDWETARETLADIIVGDYIPPEESVTKQISGATIGKGIIQ